MLSVEMSRDLRCPACKGALDASSSQLKCACGRAYPVVEGRPVLIAEERSLFQHDTYTRARITAETKGFRAWVRRLPAPSVNLSASRSIAAIKARLATRPSPRVLLVGGGVAGRAISDLASLPGIELVNTDVSPGSSAAIYCDAHDLPFADESFDAVIAQAVLEHVLDPHRCVGEIFRVLRPDGLVYSETPFMQQVHLQGFDFTRFTHLGHRRLFRWFHEVDSGVVAGPGTALAWSWRYFLSSLSSQPRWSDALYKVGRVTGFGLELFDHVLRQRPAALDAASCTYFLGSKATEPLGDHELAGGYRGVGR